MCGIAGMFALGDGRVTEGALRAMTDAMVHRGPDDEGFFTDGRGGIAMRRLSIIGLGNGRQPIANEDGSVVLVMNGEIYNYRVLREELERAGHVFSTDSDTEVGVHLYEMRGPDFVHALRGMFAFALYDRRRGTLLLGRDRVGKKPLYYAVHDGMLMFGSEIKALHATGLLPRTLDSAGVDSYLAYGFVVGERTLFGGVRKVPAGHVLHAEAGRVRVEHYWNLPLEPGPAPSFDDAVAQVRMLLANAVRERLMSEVPLGAFLSGGVDSSAVVALMARNMDAPVETFAVGFDSPDHDELRHARAVAERFRTRHREVIVRDCPPELLRQVNWHNDEPAADPAAVPTFYLSRFSRQHVTVVLTGEGGDELFGGYRHYQHARQIAELERRIPLFHALAESAGRFEAAAGLLGGPRLRKGLWIASLGADERARGFQSAFTDAELLAAVSPEVRAHLNGHRVAEFRNLQTEARGWDVVGQMLYVDAKCHLADQLLMKVDKMTMGASLEARCPLLDQRLLELVGALPTEMKVSRAGSKRVLRAAVRGLIPDDILDRPKHGFDVPLRRWLTQDLAALVHDLLLRPSTPVHRFLDADFLRGLWGRLQKGNEEQVARRLWITLNFAVWHEQQWPEEWHRT